MDRGELAFTLTQAIARAINEGRATADLSPLLTSTYPYRLQGDAKRQWERQLALGADRTLVVGMFEVLDRVGILSACPDWYLDKLLERAKLLDADEFEANPYIRAVGKVSAAVGDVRLGIERYKAGEWLQYDMPDLEEEEIVPYLGFFPRAVSFPTVTQEGAPWMSVIPSEINSMKEDIAQARGRVLVLGLGLGYYAYMVSRSPEVESITVVEVQKEVISLFNDHILPRLDTKDKIKVVKADALDYLERLTDGQYDYCYCDIWEDQVDGAEYYLAIRPHEKRLSSTRFAYWIKPQIEAYLKLTAQ